MRPDDQQALRARHRLRLQVDRGGRRPLRALEVARERLQQRQLQVGVAGFGRQRGSPAEVRDGVVDAAVPQPEQPRQLRVRERAVGVEAETAANRRFAGHDVAALHQHLPEPHVRFGTRRLERDRPFEQRLAARQRLGLRQERAAHLQGVAERDERVHVGRLDLDRLVEQGDGALYRFFGGHAQVQHAALIRLVGRRHVGIGADGAPFTRLELALQSLAHEFLDQPILQVEDLGQRAVELHRRHGVAFLDGDGLAGHAHPLAHPLHRARHHPGGAEPAAEFDRLAGVFHAGGSSGGTLHVEDLFARNAAQAVHLGEVGGERFRHPLADPVVGRLAREVGERQHGHAATGRTRNGHARAETHRRQVHAGAPGLSDRRALAQQAFPRMVQVEIELARRLVAVGRVLGERLAHQRLDVGRHRVVEARQRLGLLREDALGRLRHRRAGERRASGEHLVEHRPEREQIGAMVDLAAAQLLGRHVVQRAQHHPGHGEPERLRVIGRRRREELGQPEVEHLDSLPPGEHHVRALDVAVHDAAAVRVVEGVGHLHRDLERVGHLDRTTGQAGGEGLALHVLHGDEERLAVFDQVVGDGDVG